ncbi:MULTISPECIES: hypothetical protein [unclassified Streptomyces]|uniref:hypothetical protein n=1 Tax=unclassified Streptomyces TaxID=2593676 RepID=UPI002257658F|nr:MULTISPECIES: hypothetical protein [unclassified Streptomyces]MCX4403639.1 hypothetical protein [Streptomyces sp. NBC_01764]MCX5181409.1 hypothetical protein [Streptomyces sp. NBC_00268]
MSGPDGAVNVTALSALVAVMHKLAAAIWHILCHKTRYQDLGADSFTRRDPEHAMRPMTKEANRLGLTVRFGSSPRSRSPTSRLCSTAVSGCCCRYGRTW